MEIEEGTTSDVATGESAPTTEARQRERLAPEERRDKLLDAWGIDAGVRVGEFSREQNAYLNYHGSNVFKQSLLE